MKKYLFALLVFIAFLNLNIFPQNKEINIDILVKEAIERNPEILSAKKEYEFYKSKISESYYPSNPQIEFERMYSGDEKNFVIRQELEFPTKLYLKKKILENYYQIYRWKYLSVKNEVVYKLYEAYINYYLSFAYESLYRENIDLMKAFLKIIEAKNSSNYAKQSDILKAKIELLKIENSAELINQEKEIYKSKINSILNRDINSDLGIPSELKFEEEEFSYEDLKDKIEKNNPDLNSLLFNILIAEKNINLSKQENIPDIILSYRKRNSNNSSMDNTYDFSIGFSLPIWFKKQKDNINASKIEKEMLMAKYNSDKNEVLFKLKEILTEIQTYKKFIDLYKTAFLPQAESLVRLSMREFENNKGSFIDFLDAYRNFIEIKKEYYSYLGNYFILKAEIKRIGGEENE
jgi:cobalt-zinc-cadmium efflux system outer membrane protein